MLEVILFYADLFDMALMLAVAWGFFKHHYTCPLRNRPPNKQYQDIVRNIVMQDARGKGPMFQALHKAMCREGKTRVDKTR